MKTTQFATTTHFLMWLKQQSDIIIAKTELTDDGIIIVYDEIISRDFTIGMNEEGGLSFNKTYKAGGLTSANEAEEWMKK
jgi:hypothetical protein